MIDVQDIFHHFGIRAVLNGPTFQVQPGEITVIMGPNGMGKSTLLSCIGGALRPLSGKITINSDVRYESEESEMRVRQNVMYLPDAPWMPPLRTCRQWAVAVAKLYRSDDQFILNHVDALIRLFDMEKVADSPLSSYSAGQKKKAMLIMALAPETPVLVLDEPFSGGLDPTGLLAIKELLKKRARIARQTLLIATPTPELVEEIADRIIILKDGRIVGQGTLAELSAQAGYEGRLEGLYERISSSETETRLAEYEAGFLAR